jgi:hypothetical protein
MLLTILMLYYRFLCRSLLGQIMLVCGVVIFEVTFGPNYATNYATNDVAIFH